eukprot:6949011-Alexandrium_andersonii.AAC.1
MAKPDINSGVNILKQVQCTVKDGTIGVDAKKQIYEYRDTLMKDAGFVPPGKGKNKKVSKKPAANGKARKKPAASRAQDRASQHV